MKTNKSNGKGKYSKGGSNTKGMASDGRTSKYPQERTRVYEGGKNEKSFRGTNRFNTAKDTGEHDNSNNHHANDPEWYLNRNNTGLAGSYSFFEPIGTSIPTLESQVVLNDSATGLTRTGVGTKLPGICTIELQHTIGSSGFGYGEEPGIAAINVGANKLYADIRHANSGARNYEKSDLAIYLLAVADAYSFYGMMCRAYACMRKYNTQNRYLARRLVEALGFDFTSIAYNLPAFKTYINQYAMRLNVLFIPNNWPYFKRRYMLYSHIFRDEASDKAQLYAFIPRYFFKFGRDANTGKGQLYASYFTWAAHLTLNSIIAMGDALISDIILDDDFNLMSGDIAKYTSDLFTLPYMAEDYIIDFTDDDLVLAQIENLTIEGAITIPTSGLLIDQDYDANNNDYLKFLPQIEYAHGATWSVTDEIRVASEIARRMFNIHTPTIDEGSILDATRLMNLPSAVNIDATKVYKYYKYASTEIVEGVYLYTDASSTGAQDSAKQTCGIAAASGYISNRAAVALTMFKHAPLIPILNSSISGSVATNTVIGYTSNLDNYILMDVSDMKRLHTAALLSLFDVN